MKAAKRHLVRPIMIITAIVLVSLSAILSVMIGSRAIALSDILSLIGGAEADPLYLPILQKRILRTAIGLIAGCALGISGCLMQSVTRNPIADPSILGVNTGASLFVVSAIAFLGINKPYEYIFFALLGALCAAFVVFGISALTRQSGTNTDPIRLALSGACVSIACSCLISTVMLPRTNVMQVFRFWQTGSIGGGSWQSVGMVLPFIVSAVILAIILIPSLNVLALGDEVATGLGVNVRRTRLLGALAGVILCGSVTAITGPIAFVGLMVPHMVGLFMGSDLRFVLPLSALFGSALLLFADIAGRVVARPSEMEVGIVTAFIGAPVFIMIIRNRRVNK